MSVSIDRPKHVSAGDKLACGQTSPELLYLETKWASLIAYAKVAELLKDVLPSSFTLVPLDPPTFLTLSYFLLFKFQLSGKS